MDFTKDLVAFFENNNTKKYIHLMSEIKNDENYPSLNYYGVNFLNNNLSSIKLYTTFFNKKSIEVAKQILPSLKEFDKYFHLFQESKKPDLQNTGCAFTFKINIDQTIKKGFHFRFPVNNNNLYSKPKYISLSDDDLKNYQGISFEYSTNGLNKKNYYYISDIKTKNKLAILFNKPEILKATLIEYTESNTDSKIIIWDDEVSGNTRKVSSIITGSHLIFNNFINDKLNLKSHFEGLYLNKPETASYFYFFKNKSDILFDFKINKNIDTIGYVVANITP